MRIDETIRKDGLRIISCYIPHKKSLLAEVVARIGYANDPSDKPGLFHCFEHMAFKGTKKRSIEELQSFAGKNFFDRNAGTGPLTTTYQATVIDRKLPLACDYLCDIYLNSTFPAAELEKEKRPILLEIARTKDDDFAIANQALRKLLYKENPLRVFGSGTVEGIRKINRGDLIDQKKKWYLPSNTIAIAVGNVNHQDFVKEISKRIPLNPKKVLIKGWNDEVDKNPTKKEVIIKKPKRNKTIIFFGCKIPIDIDIRTTEAVSFFSKMMGLGSNSILWNEVREKRGLAYVIGSAYSGSSGLGNLFYVQTEVDHTNYIRVIKLLEKILSKPLSEKQQFEELRERVLDAFEVASVEQNIEYYEGLILRNILENKPVKNIKSEDKGRLKVISNLSLKDIEQIRKKFIRMDRFARVIVTI
jgi:predicted Zn-dependent peptidase